MFKIKLKLSLVDDYIFICKVYNCYSNFGESGDEIQNGILTIATDLKDKYEQIFFKLGYLNQTLKQLKEDISYSKCLDFAFFDCDETKKIHKNITILQKLKEIDQNMVKKMKKLTFNQQEIGFVLNKTI